MNGVGDELEDIERQSLESKRSVVEETTERGVLRHGRTTKGGKGMGCQRDRILESGQAERDRIWETSQKDAEDGESLQLKSQRGSAYIQQSAHRSVVLHHPRVETMNWSSQGWVSLAMATATVDMRTRNGSRIPGRPNSAAHWTKACGRLA